MGRGIVKALPFDADGREQENIFDSFNAQASVEAAVAAVVPYLNINEGASPAGGCLPPKRASDLWSHGTPVYRSPKAASLVSVASLSSIDSEGCSLQGVPAGQGTHVAEKAAQDGPMDFDDAASVETVVAPVDPDRRLPAGAEVLVDKDSAGSVQYFDMSPGHMSAATNLATDDVPPDNAVPDERPEVVGSPSLRSGANLTQPEALHLDAPFPLFGDESPQDALGSRPSSPKSN
eukprot:2566710-Amphidinium_carterae.1